LFRAQGLSLHLLTSGVLLERCAADVVREFSRVVVSLDAADEGLYAAIRGVNALRAVERGVARVRMLAPDLPVTARATLHRANFRELPRLIDHAMAMGLDGISFLAADTFSSAFGRAAAPPRAGNSPASLALSAAEVAEFAEVVDATLVSHAAAFETGFVAESPARLRRLPQYYAALAGRGPFPPVSCNAPWISVVVEADGTVRPCFFHAALGNLRTATLTSIVTRNLPAFRASLDLSRDATCTRCVCSIKGGWRHAPWQ
jgi:MoaA/NifB/PqqE/SkfB family radical SAM enzyme